MRLNGGKIIITSVLLVIIFEFDVVSCVRRRIRQRVQAPAYAGFVDQYRDIEGQLNNLRHGFHLNELIQLAQQAQNLYEFARHPEIIPNYNQVNINLCLKGKLQKNCCILFLCLFFL
uniref:Uncharacterized protein n=1 Tax=Meloidogyne enterolobii TaxID=390850 RepID=A0A6V7X5S4_MELEN|nr:unnamed protein product [Meloidogyne enterolobii]